MHHPIFVLNMKDNPGCHFYRVDRKSPLGNPFGLSEGRETCLLAYQEYLRAIYTKNIYQFNSVIEKYRRLLIHNWERPSVEEVNMRFLELVKRSSFGTVNLGCWCCSSKVTGDEDPTDFVCHAQVLARAIILINKKSTRPT